MNKINWDKWQKEVDEHNPNCPWIDHKPYDDEMTKQEKADWKADEEED